MGCGCRVGTRGTGLGFSNGRSKPQGERERGRLQLMLVGASLCSSVAERGQSSAGVEERRESGWKEEGESFQVGLGRQR
jgi:hypothetical protein